MLLNFNLGGNMCITFSRSQDEGFKGECDIVEHLANFIGNSAVAVVGGTALATIAYVALNALGYETLTAAALATVLPYIPVTLTAFGLAPLAGGIAAAGTVIALMIYLASTRDK